MSDDTTPWVGRVVTTERQDAIARAYWMTGMTATEIVRMHGLKTSCSKVNTYAGSATLNFNCEDCGKPAVVTARSGAREEILDHDKPWRKAPYRCRGCWIADRDRKRVGQWKEQKQALLRAEELRWMPYRDYLGTDDWSERRKEVIRRAEFKCQVCATGGRLHVHHRTYARRGNERKDDMIALCADCHELFHTHGKLAEGGRAA